MRSTLMHSAARFLPALLLTAAACAGNGGGSTACPDGTASSGAPRTLTGVLDTSFTVSGAPYGAAAGSRGLGYVTLHNIAALGRYNFATRTYTDSAVAVGDQPTNLVFSPDAHRAYVASQFSDRVDVVSVCSGSIISTATMQNDPYQTAVLPNGTRFYASGNADRIWVYDASNLTLLDSIPVSADPNAMAISPDGSKMFITHLSSGVIGRLTLATLAYDTLAVVGATPVHGIAISGDGSKVYVVSQGTDSLYSFSTTTGTNLGQVYAGVSPFGLALTPDGSEIWVTTLGGQLRRHSRATLAPVDSLALGGTLRRIAIDPAGRGALIADEGGRVIIVK